MKRKPIDSNSGIHIDSPMCRSRIVFVTNTIPRVCSCIDCRIRMIVTGETVSAVVI